MKKFIILFIFALVDFCHSEMIREKKILNKPQDLNLKDKLTQYEDEMKQRKPKEKDFTQELSREFKNIIIDILKNKADKPDSLPQRRSFLQLERKIGATDDPAKFLNYTFETNIQKLPIEGEVKNMPWSGSYWPIRYGVISVRYNKNENNTMGLYSEEFNNFTINYDWKKSIEMYKQPSENLVMLNTGAQVYENHVNENYSPSEKYDLLIGDKDFTLTNYLKAYTKSFGDRLGIIPDWFGICHGWSPASYMVAKPKHSVILTAANGKTKIEFLPDDIKALASLYWANVDFTTNFIGGVCKDSTPNATNSDPDTGLWTANECFSINPAAFVITLANHVGIKKQNLVFDPDADNEIWNQPIIDYKFNYFNVLDNNFYTKMEDNKEEIAKLKDSDDKFLKYVYNKAITNVQAKFIVGVLMVVDYIVEMQPSHVSQATYDMYKNVTFLAYLELDAKDNIVGGEWKYNHHPNFIWKPDENKPIKGCCDAGLPEFEGTVSNALKSSAVMASKKGQIIRQIIDYISMMSNETMDTPTIETPPPVTNNNNNLNNGVSSPTTTTVVTPARPSTTTTGSTTSPTASTTTSTRPSTTTTSTRPSTTTTSTRPSTTTTSPTASTTASTRPSTTTTSPTTSTHPTTTSTTSSPYETGYYGNTGTSSTGYPSTTSSTTYPSTTSPSTTYPNSYYTYPSTTSSTYPSSSYTYPSTTSSTSTTYPSSYYTYPSTTSSTSTYPTSTGTTATYPNNYYTTSYTYPGSSTSSTSPTSSYYYPSSTYSYPSSTSTSSPSYTYDYNSGTRSLASNILSNTYNLLNGINSYAS